MESLNSILTMIRGRKQLVDPHDYRRRLNWYDPIAKGLRWEGLRASFSLIARFDLVHNALSVLAATFRKVRFIGVPMLNLMLK